MIIPGIKIPWQVWACAGLVALLVGAGWKLYDLGQDHKQAEWDAAVERGKVILRNMQTNQGTVTTKVVTETVEKIKVVKEKGDVIVKTVKVLVPSDSCPLPGGFRVLHDAAAANTIPDTSQGATAEPVPAQTAATTVTENYTTCNAAIADLQGLRQWVTRHHQVYLDQCKASPALCNVDTPDKP